MINYSQLQINHNQQDGLELFQAEPFHDFHRIHNNGFLEEASSLVIEQKNKINEQDYCQDLQIKYFNQHSQQQGPDLTISHQDNQIFKHSEESQFHHNQLRQQRRMKNQTKNIPKNFGKGIISFIQKNEKKIKALMTQYKLPYNSFKAMMKNQKKTINTIADLRRLWTNQPYCKVMRIISNLFFRRYALDYIFNSRISNYSSHIKYRQSLWQAIKNPNQFNHIKQY